MKIGELCKMIEDSIHSGRYPFDTEVQRKCASLLQVINRSDTDDLRGSDIKVETRVQNLFVLNNYLPELQHLPGIIELDVLDSFKMICRKLERLDEGIKLGKR
ncbi:MAG: hypothetical protein MN733_15160 [Nitrososphaera sp.]|nr:hypothetical protein [Nitrososphaera sp.]